MAGSILKSAIKAKINSGDWPTVLSDELLEMCYQVARYNSQSRNSLDQIDQKNLWIALHKQPAGYSDISFCVTGLTHSSLQHHDNRPALCMHYLRQAGEEVTAEVGIWRLWNPPTDAPRASDIQLDAKSAEEQAEDIKRIAGNLNKTLEEREDGEPNPLDEPLRPSRSGYYPRDKRNKDDKDTKDDQEAKNRLTGTQ